MFAISPINTTNKIYTPSFGVYYHTLEDKAGNIIYRGDTCFFRKDFNWPKFVDFIYEKYKDVNDVQIILHACSNGEEAYSLIPVLIERLGRDAQKFFPILAKDIDATHIDLAKKGKYCMTFIEKQKACIYTNNKFDKYFNEIKLNSKEVVEPKEILKSAVKFEVGDILKDIQTIPLKNKILLARNFMPYLGREKVYEYIQSLAKNFDKTTTLVIGGFDSEYGMDYVLEKYGFKRGQVNGIFELK